MGCVKNYLSVVVNGANIWVFKCEKKHEDMSCQNTQTYKYFQTINSCFEPKPNNELGLRSDYNGSYENFVYKYSKVYIF